MPSDLVKFLEEDSVARELVPVVEDVSDSEHKRAAMSRNVAWGSSALRTTGRGTALSLITTRVLMIGRLFLCASAWERPLFLVHRVMTWYNKSNGKFARCSRCLLSKR